MISWVLIIYLFNGTLQPTVKTQTVEFAGQCRAACSTIMKEGVYQGEQVVHCTCKKSTDYYKL
jgi:hypothetical protein